ncbi:hypothetical protein PRIPAC_96611 [Pristionchus pacificus]|uniref:Uncharacterized protein n=1 Tax=Pristionchus pacificus TaxID=54126 RepID=A0A2A6CUA1_PRIPA|nr:hypothetical protein PRIPAC_96611 [Pristionchus pacificus]|eukprot:PDM81611.1 hypothetical protein PRIPAC_30592 [Pristionchus pacificus]
MMAQQDTNLKKNINSREKNTISVTLGLILRFQNSTEQSLSYIRKNNVKMCDIYLLFDGQVHIFPRKPPKSTRNMRKNKSAFLE